MKERFALKCSIVKRPFMPKQKSLMPSPWKVVV